MKNVSNLFNRNSKNIITTLMIVSGLCLEGAGLYEFITKKKLPVSKENLISKSVYKSMIENVNDISVTNKLLIGSPLVILGGRLLSSSKKTLI